MLLNQTLQEKKEIAGTRVDARDPGSAEPLGKEVDAPSAGELEREGGGATTGFREHGQGDPPPPRTTRVHPLLQKIRINASQLTTTLQNSSPNITSTRAMTHRLLNTFPPLAKSGIAIAQSSYKTLLHHYLVLFLENVERRGMEIER